MITVRQRLLVWIERARPPRAALVKAITTGIVASLANVALLVGAVALLVESSLKPGLQTVLGALIVIELFAFLRSPLRFAERMSAHRLGYDAVSRWRSWLVRAVGTMSYQQWRTFAAGDLLERSLHDTDELQDLWLRSLLPFLTSSVVLLVTDIIVVTLSPRYGWWAVALLLVIIQCLGIGAQIASAPGLIRIDRIQRTARSNYRATLIELSAITPELVLLDRSDYVAQRSRHSTDLLDRAEKMVASRRRLIGTIAPLATIASVVVLEMRPQSAPLWTVVSAMIAVATFELLRATQSAVETSVSVIGGAERIEELEGAVPVQSSPWPEDHTIRLQGVSIEENGTVLLHDASLVAAPGERVAITGASGAGKSTLLRAMAKLDSPSSGLIFIGPLSLDQIDEQELRRHLAYVPSDPGLLRGYAVDVITLGRTTVRDAFADLAELGMSVEPTSRWENLSRGEAERVAIARAIATSPSILLLDEPTSGLGSRETSEVLTLLAVSGATIIVATHDPHVVAWCDQVLAIDESMLVRLSR